MKASENKFRTVTIQANVGWTSQNHSKDQTNEKLSSKHVKAKTTLLARTNINGKMPPPRITIPRLNIEAAMTIQCITRTSTLEGSY